MKKSKVTEYMCDMSFTEMERTVLIQVAENWQHPKDAEGNLIPLIPWYNECVADFINGEVAIQAGLVSTHTYLDGRWFFTWHTRDKSCVDLNSDWASGTEWTLEKWRAEIRDPRTDPNDYLPALTDTDVRVWQFYAVAAKGTPTSPRFRSKAMAYEYMLLCNQAYLLNSSEDDE